MKKILLFILCSISLCADDLVWDDANPPGKVKQFDIWRESDLGVWTNLVSVPTNRWKITLPAGVHRLAVSAVGIGSNEVSSPLSAPTILTVFIVPANVRIEK